MVIRLLILGIIKRRGSAHGYRMYRDLVEWRIETWTVIRPGSIYHALTQMEKLSHIKRADTSSSQKLGPSKAEYCLTPAGDKEFFALLSKALKGINIIELSVGIAFMEYLPRAMAVNLLRQRVVSQKQVTAFLRTLPTQDAPDTPAQHPELIRIWESNYADSSASTEKLIHAIQSGKYVFKNEG